MIPYPTLYIYEIIGGLQIQRILLRKTSSAAGTKGRKEVGFVCASIHLQVIESLLKKKAFFRKRWFILSGVFEKDAREIERRLIGKLLKLFRGYKKKTDCPWLVSIKRAS